MSDEPRPIIDTAERRRRLAVRHRLHPAARAPDAEEAARSVVGLHATDPATVYLSAWARVDGFEVGHLEHALYEDRTLVKHLAMRRTLWVVPRDLLGAVQAGASDRVAAAERARLIKDVERSRLRTDGEAWLAEATAAVEDALSDGEGASSAQLRGRIPLLEGSVVYGEGKSWGGAIPVAPRVLTVLATSGVLVRGHNDGAWMSSRPLWTTAASWLGAPIERPEADAALATLVEAWLRRFGPGTETDIVWWLGNTKTAVRQALATLGAVEVELEGEGEQPGYVLAEDLEPTSDTGPWGALLPSLDPTTMGWKQREWYLGPHAGEVFDTNGNGGATAWWDGRIVGGWRHGEDGAVEVQLLEDIGREGEAALDREAARLTEWLAGAKPAPRFPGPLSKR